MLDAAELKARMDFMEKRMDKMESGMEQMNKQIDEVVRFTTKIEVMFDHLSKSLSKLESKFDIFLEKNEIKEEAARKEATQSQEKEISRWKTISFEAVKWILIILGVGTAGQNGLEILKNFIK